MDQYRIAVLVGSLRRESFNRKLALALTQLAPADFRLEQAELGDLPPYNQDDDAHQAPPVLRLKTQVADAQGVLFVTPEYNRSVPGVLKNAIDVGSRPYGQSVWAGKPAAIMTLSPGALGGFGANHHLRQSLVFLDMPPMQQPEAYIGGAATLFAEDGAVQNESTGQFFQNFMQRFAAWIETNVAGH